MLVWQQNVNGHESIIIEHLSERARNELLHGEDHSWEPTWTDADETQLALVLLCNGGDILTAYTFMGVKCVSYIP
jgi:hypothetical protein